LTDTLSTNVPQESYPKLFWRFLEFGLLARGGPVAQIAMIRQELVNEEKWISNERFNRVIVALRQFITSRDRLERQLDENIKLFCINIFARIHLKLLPQHFE
jgi:hypothetical protein